jgi:hypothetical protein
MGGGGSGHLMPVASRSFRVDGRAYLSIDGEVRASASFQPESYSDPGSMYQPIHKLLAPGEVAYFPATPDGVTAMRPAQIALQMSAGGRGHLSYVMPTSDGMYAAALPTVNRGQPRILAGTDVYELALPGVAPFYESGKWVNWRVNVPSRMGLVTAVRDWDPSAGDRFHHDGQLLEAAFPDPPTAPDVGEYEQLAARVIWGPDNAQVFGAPQHFCAFIAAEILQAGIDPATLAVMAYITFDVTSYPYRLDRADDHPSVAGKGGTDDAQWKATVSLNLPTPSHVFPGWAVPRSNLENYPDLGHFQPLAPPVNMVRNTWTSGARMGWIAFPMARGARNKVTMLEPPQPAIDWNRITAMQIRMWWDPSDLAKVGRPLDGIVFTPPRLAWNRFDGAMIDPVFATDAFIGIQGGGGGGGAYSICNIGDTASTVSGYIASRGHDGSS